MQNKSKTVINKLSSSSKLKSLSISKLSNIIASLFMLLLLISLLAFIPKSKASILISISEVSDLFLLSISVFLLFFVAKNMI